jgi:transketolase
MRNAFAKAVIKLVDVNPNLVLLAGDIGNRLFDPFKEKCPERFYNCGVAEANMTGIASGLAASGLRPITYTITPFNTTRCFEQIRVDVCYPNLPVIIVGTGGGLSYANLGVTHHSMEDIAILRSLPNMHVVCPGDPIEVGLALKDALRLERPTYIRLGKKGEPILHKDEPYFEIGKGITIKDGTEVAILSVGNMLSLALDCAELLLERQISTRVISLHTVKPLDEPLLHSLFADYQKVVVLEEHGLIGGAGSAVLEWGNKEQVDLGKLIRLGGPDRFLAACGDQVEARQKIGFEPIAITTKIMTALEFK